MPGSADFIQKTVHTLETGAVALWIRRSLLLVGAIVLAVYQIYYFRGLVTPQAMDQAQIGREIASFHGWRTNLIRPRAIGQLSAHGKNVARNIQHDTYEAPLPPLVDAVALRLVKAHWKISPRDLIYAGDKVIAGESVALFYLSIVALFFVARRLFDQRLAFLVCGLVLLCDMLWQYCLSGLPQMLMLVIFNSTLYALVRAIQARNSQQPTTMGLAAAGLGFGLLALSHALTLWMFVAALVFLVFYFRPRLRSTLIVLGIVIVLYAPWLLRNFVLTGNPAGVAIYSVLDGVRHSEAAHMRMLAGESGGAGVAPFRDKIIANFITETNGLFGHLGWSAVALMFFASFLHQFKSREASILRWMILAMWAGALLGMSVYGVTPEESVAANELHVLFIPIMSCFGLAWLLVQWSRLGFSEIARLGFVGSLYLVCALPLIFNLPLFTPSSRPQIHWPPYVPPFIGVLNDWMKPNEIIASDMPWAIAWYADRRSVWLPESVQRFTELNDYGVLGGPINGLYLTPVSGSQNKLGDIVKGDYKDWAPVILRNVDMQKFPLKWGTLLGIESECVFFSDHDRQKGANLQ
jgi:Dolichyl-phosphate-mannose-protein mannosyltransferase